MNTTVNPTNPNQFNLHHGRRRRRIRLPSNIFALFNRVTLDFTTRNQLHDKAAELKALIDAIDDHDDHEENPEDFSFRSKLALIQQWLVLRAVILMLAAHPTRKFRSLRTFIILWEQELELLIALA